jgi:hypothetical protein
MPWTSFDSHGRSVARVWIRLAMRKSRPSMSLVSNFSSPADGARGCCSHHDAGISILAAGALQSAASVHLDGARC